MDKNTVVITEQNGKYHVENNGISEFALIGILECIIFDMKTAAGRKDLPIERQETGEEQKEPVRETSRETVRETNKKTVQASNSPDLRTRISNAVKAIKGLGGEAADGDRSDSTDEELQAELEDLTNQYKRLKSSQEAKK